MPNKEGNAPRVHRKPRPVGRSDPEYMEEIFETYKYMGWTPEKIKDPQEREEYAAWLNESP